MSNLIVDCLLPNAVIVPLSINQNCSLSSLKEILWREAKKYPLYNLLNHHDDYIFVGVTSNFEQEEFWDETREVVDLKLFSPVVKVVKKIRTTEEKSFNTSIANVVGRPLSDLDLSKDEEIWTFRKNVVQVISEAVLSRHQQGMVSLAIYQHPPELEPTHNLPQSLMALMENGFVTIDVWATVTKSFSISVSWDIYPEGIISEALRLIPVESEQLSKDSCVIKGVAKYALKICGTNEYLLANRPVTQYKTIRHWISQCKRPQLYLVKRGDLYASLTKFNFEICETSIESKNGSVNLATDYHVEAAEGTISLWHSSMQGRLKIHILKAGNISPSLKASAKVFVRASLYHGSFSLCPHIETSEVHFTYGSDDTVSLDMGEWLEFDLAIQEAPRATKLCLALYTRGALGDKKKKKPNEEETLIGWGGLNLFDYTNKLCHGKQGIKLSPPSLSEGFSQAPKSSAFSSIKDSLQLEVEFEQRFAQSVIFPDETQMHDYARYIIKLEAQSKKICTDAELEKIHALCGKESSDSLSHEEKEFLWLYRKYCMRIPDSLPRLLDSLNWQSRDDVCQLYLMLEDWPLVSTETALELLQYSYADTKVREHAVTSLSRTLPDEKLAQYMLQLVHTLKQEAYLDSPLLRFLLHKALTNKNLGHLFFWYIRSELDLWPCPLRAVAILEAFCRGLGPDLEYLNNHVRMVNKMSLLADAVKEKRCDNNKDRNKLLHKLLMKNEFRCSLQHLSSPLRPSLTLGRLRLSECKVLESARRPICLVWDNSEPMGHHFSMSHSVIFKSGDDLRQDMLTLQIICLMAHVWNSEGLDMRMTPYSCQATGNRTGLIEVVRNAKTVYSIQKRAKLGAIQVDSSQLYKWIRDNNQGKVSQAVETFTRSCAGYCVATFILGIGDRHPDNIMVDEEGQIFHIDFGHFLGNFKKKFGLKRERVPFVLTQDFLRVIASGVDNPKESEAFKRFQELCGKAYLALRKHSRLILSLFTLLLSTGLPELQTIEDIDFLKRTLAVGCTEAEALLFFQEQFYEAYGGAWTTKLDWFFHSVKHR